MRSPGTPAVVILAVLAAAALCCTPCLALAYTYLDPGEQPTLVIHTEGDPEYYPGDTFTMTVVLTNRGRDTALQVAPLLTPGVYDPSTALGVTVRPRAGNAPVTLKSLPVMAGDIGSWGEARVTIEGTVSRNASPGAYAIPLNISYQYVYAIPMSGEAYSSVDLLYRKKVLELPAIFRVRSDVRPAIAGERAENLVPGTQGYLDVSVENTGYATGSEVTLRIVPEDNVTFQMVDDSIFLSEFRPGDVVPLRVRIAVKDHTAAGSYPAVLTGEYKDADGIVRTTPPVPIGIPVSQGAVLEAVTRNLTIAPNGQETITVSYRNSGDTPAYDAQARIIGTHVLVPTVGSASLGTIGPGEIMTARYLLSADTAISGKQYVLGTDVKYRDGLGALVLSDKMVIGIAVKSPSGAAAVTGNPVILIAIAGTIAILAYAGWRIREKLAKKE